MDMKKLSVAALTLTLVFAGGTGCATDSVNGASNRDEAVNDATGSRRAQGLDSSARDPHEFGQTASNMSPQDSANGSMSGQALTGDATLDTTSGTTTGASTEEQALIIKKIKSSRP